MRGDKRELRVLFLDLNAYFASVEQQEKPELRGKPIAVVPVVTDSSFVIAASYEAKAFGIKTGTRIGEAKAMCPDLQLVTGGHAMYTVYHRRVLAAVETVLPIHRVRSIDEMEFRLLGTEREPENARGLARRLKEALHDHVGECMKCSIGIAPNSFLAKVGTELQKPDGLVTLEATDLPEALYSLKLTDIPGINRRMLARLQAHRIFTTKDLTGAERTHLHEAFGSIIGDRWWYLLRGYDLPEQETVRKSLGHSHVLPPDLRNDEGVKQVMLRLVQKAASRLRSNGLWTRHMEVAVRGKTKSWSEKVHLSPTQDSITLTKAFLELWEKRSFVGPLTAYITFTELVPAEQVTPSLFDQAVERAQLSHAVDEVNRKFGKHSVYLAGMNKARNSAPERIAFQKTELFSEGLGDHEWVDTRTGKEIDLPL